MKIIKASALILALLMLAIPLAGCMPSETPETGGDLAGTYDVVVWFSEVAGVKELTEAQIDAFERANPGIVINATVESVTEGDAASKMINDVSKGADIFCFAQDQLARLVRAGALAELGTGSAATVAAMNDDASLEAAKIGGKLYCYPLTADNGYFMYYDKRVVKESSIDSLEAIIKDCEAAGKRFSFELEGSAFYTASFFFGAGCKSVWTTDADGKYTAVDDDFNSEKGVIAMKGMNKLTSSPVFNNSSAGTVFADATPSAVLISGTWAADAVKGILGENYGVADLPSYEVNGMSYHLGSFSGNKLLGVKPQTDTKRAAVLQRLALYLTGKECQEQRFERFSWGPSNKEAQATDAVKQNETLGALLAQNEFATPQGQIHGSWWDIAKVLGTASKNISGDNIKNALNKYESEIKKELGE